MSDVVIVSRDTFRNGHAEHVPYGTILVDDDDMVESEQHSFESLQDGVVPAVDWRGIDQVDRPVAARRGRPKGSKNKPKGA